MDHRIAVLGAGNLGSALMRGLLRAGAVEAKQLTATVGAEEHARDLAKDLSIEVTTGNNAQVASQSNIVVLAVKPAKVRAVLEEIGGALRPEQILLSLAAAVPITLIESWLPRPRAVFRAMPNLAMSVGQSATAISANALATDEQRKVVKQVFDAVGVTVSVDDRQMHAVTALAGSGPGFVYWLMEKFTEAGAGLGLSAEDASALVRQTFLGASRLIQETNADPAALRRQVTTPGGTTAAGIEVLENQAVQQALAAAIAAGTSRSEQLAESFLKET